MPPPNPPTRLKPPATRSKTAKRKASTSSAMDVDGVPDADGVFAPDPPATTSNASDDDDDPVPVHIRVEPPSNARPSREVFLSSHSFEWAFQFIEREAQARGMPVFELLYRKPGAPLQKLTEIAFDNAFHGKWKLFVAKTKNSRNNPILVRAPTSLSRTIHAFRGQVANFFRAEIIGRIFEDSNFNWKALLRRAQYLTQFGIVAWEYLRLGLSDKEERLFKSLRHWKLRVDLDADEQEEKPFDANHFPRTHEELAKASASTDLKNLLQTCGELLCPADPEKCRRFDCVLALTLQYIRDPQCSPESQFFHLFWCPVFEYLLRRPSSILVATTQYLIPTRPMTAPKAAPLRVDFAALFAADRTRKPVFLCEATGHALSRDEKVPGYFHKDYAKFGWCMFRFYLYYAGVFRNVPEVLRQLRIYGALVAGTQIQYCVLYETHPDTPFGDMENGTKSSLVYQTCTKNWLVDWNRKWEDPVASDGDICTRSKNGGQFVQPTSENELTDLPELTPDSSFVNNPEDVGGIERTGETGENEDTYDRINPPEGNDLSHSIMSLMGFFEEVQGYAEWMDDQFRLHRDKLSEPLQSPEELESLKPESNTQHPKNAPNKQNDSPIVKEELVRSTGTRTSGQRRQIFSVQKEVCSSTLLEVEILKEFGGSRHVVEFFGSRHLDNVVEMQLELLVLAPVDLETNAIKCLGYGISYLADIVDAVQYLSENKIVHRDISPNNIMFSAEKGCWKLIDFEASRYMDDTDSYCNTKEGGKVGTRGYRAPECESTSVYTTMSDVYSLGKSYIGVMANPIMNHAVLGGLEESEEMERLAMRLEQVANRMWRTDPTRRPQPSLVLEWLETIYNDALEVFGGYGELDIIPCFEREQEGEVGEAR